MKHLTQISVLILNLIIQKGSIDVPRPLNVKVSATAPSMAGAKANLSVRSFILVM